MRQPRFLGMREDKAPLECLRGGPACDAASPAEPAPSHAPAPAQRPRPRASRPRPRPRRAHARTPANAAGPRPRPPGLKLANPRQGALSARRHHQARDLGLLHGDRALHAPAPRRAPADAAALPERHRRGRVVPAERARRRRRDFVRLVDSGPRHDHKKRIVCDNARDAAVAREPRRAHDPRWSRPRRRRGDERAPPSTTPSAQPGLRRARSRSRRRPVVAPRRGGARTVRTLLDALKLESFVKTSGKRGVHVLVPDRARPDARRGDRRSPSRSRARWPRCSRRWRPSSA